MTKHRRFVLVTLASIALVQTACAQTAGLPSVGQQAPAFTLTSGEGKLVSLESLKGSWVVLYFYPKNFTGGCTMEAQSFQRDIAEYEKLGAVIVGVSVDSVQSHKEFCAKEGLSFTLLADTAGTVSSLYGSLNERNGRRTSARNTFLIDPHGRIAAVFTGVNPAAHSSEVLEEIARAKGQ